MTFWSRVSVSNDTSTLCGLQLGLPSHKVWLRSALPGYTFWVCAMPEGPPAKLSQGGCSRVHCGTVCGSRPGPLGTEQAQPSERWAHPGAAAAEAPPSGPQHELQLESMSCCQPSHLADSTAPLRE